jgi:hypothetical protein
MLLTCGAPVLAQIPIERPYRGLFGSAGGPVATHTFDLMASAVEAYDDDVLADTGSLETTSAPPVSGFFSMFTLAPSYQWLGTAGQINANFASTFAYYPHLDELRSVSRSAGFGVAWQFGSSRLLLNQDAAYSPSYLYWVFPSVDPLVPGTVPPPAPDYEVDGFSSFTYGTLVSFSRPISRRGSLSVDGHYRMADFSEASGQPDMNAFGFRGTFSHRFTRNTATRFGYSYRGGDVGGDDIRGQTEAHGVEFGTDYSKPLSATRRAVFGFSLGSSLVSATDAVALPGQDSRYFANGALSFGYQFGARWQTRAIYRADLQYVPELTEPLLTNGLTAVVDGLLTQRMDFLASGSYSNGSSALSQDAATLDTYTVNLRVRHAISRNWAVYGEYLYYFYEFTARTPQSATVPPGIERNGVRVGLTMWLPLLRR